MGVIINICLMILYNGSLIAENLWIEFSDPNNSAISPIISSKAAPFFPKNETNAIEDIIPMIPAMAEFLKMS